MTQRSKTIQRKIHFFKTSLTSGIGKTLADVQVKDVLEHILLLPINENGRYLRAAGAQNRDLYLWCYTEDEDGIIEGKLAFSRTGAFPLKEEIGTCDLKPIAGIKASERVAEVTHFVFFPKNSVLAIEFNPQGPRHGSLAQYLKYRSGGLVDNIEMTYLTDREFQKRLAKIDEKSISKISIKIAVDKVERLKTRDEGLYMAYKAAPGIENAQDVEVTVSIGKKRGNHLNVIDAIKSLLKKNPDEENLLSKAVISAHDIESGEMVKFNLLEEHLVATISVIKQDERNVIDSADMFYKIRAAYSQKEPEIRCLL